MCSKVRRMHGAAELAMLPLKQGPATTISDRADVGTGLSIHPQPQSASACRVLGAAVPAGDTAASKPKATPALVSGTPEESQDKL